MSNFIVFNGGIFNSTISCVVYTDKSVEEIYETMNEFFNCYKLALKKSTGNSQLTKSNINMCALNKIIDEDTFDNLMENILHNYFKVDDVINDRITDFATNKTNEKMGYKKVNDIDCWFIAMSVGPLKKIVMDVAKATGDNYKFEVFPKKMTKQTKTTAPKTKKFQIEDDDEDKPTIKPITIKEIKKEETENKQKIKKAKKEESESDEDNGILKPIAKKSQKSKSSRSLSKDETLKKESGKIKVKTMTSEDSDDEIQEEIIKPKAIKKIKEENEETKPKKKSKKEINFDDSNEVYDFDELEDLSISDISSTSEVEEMVEESDD